MAKPSVCGTFYQVVDADGVYGAANLLRPKDDTESTLTDVYLKQENKKPGEMRLVHKQKQEDMWNSAVKGHATFGGRCENPTFSICKELPKGLCWKQCLECENCEYKGAMFKLYEEVETPKRKPKKKGDKELGMPGAKAARPNRAFQVGLQETPLGNAGARTLLIATNIPAPSRAGMNAGAVKVGQQTSVAVSGELKKERLRLKETNKARGLPEDANINISIDARYNSSTIASRNKPGQNASQAIALAVEHQTAGKKIVGAYMENKLCWTGSRLRNKGFKVSCPDGHEGDCTATLKETEPLSELRMGEKIGEMFAEVKVPIKYVTTDGDGRSAEGVQTAMEKLIGVERKADPVHIGQSQIRQTMSSVFSDQMFPGPTQEAKKQQQNALARDIKNRCHAIFEQMWKDQGGDIRVMASRMPGVIACTLNCYDGDCSKCRRHSIVCGGGKRNNWWRKSVQLNTGALSQRSLNMSEVDRALLKELLSIKLGEAALQLLDKNTNTCKNEGINRAISTSLPKNVNRSRTGKPRMLAVCDRINKGPGESLLFKLQTVGAPIAKGGRVARGAKALQQEKRYQQQYRQKASVRKHINQAKFTKYRTFNQAKAERKVQGDRAKYAKGQLDPHVDQAKVRAANQRLRAEQTRRLRQAKATSKEKKAEEKAQKAKGRKHTKKHAPHTKTTYDRKDDHTYAH